jgi:LEA14-like dessication related protein
MSRIATSLALLVGIAVTGCTGAQNPSVRVLGVQEASRHEVVFVQVTNPAGKPMRLTRLDYVFAAQGTTVSEGAVPLARELPANSAVIVEVPLIGDAPSGESLTLKGKLTARVDEIVKSYSVSAKIETPPTKTEVE